MSHKRLTTWQKATALVPLALLSGAWTTSLTVTGSATASPGDGPTLPDGSSVPRRPVDAPASVSVPGQIAPGVPAGSVSAVLGGASTNGIPAAALAAYQRAAQVIDQADPSCRLRWPLIAAIGRVESNHGRFDGNTLTAKGISEPGIFGIPLDGTHGTQRVSDTDAGQFDDDPVYDRAVGPMQFIPSTWSVVGVDGDGDGRRNPQDINDAALASAVYLCSGNENLSTPAGQRAAVYHYNHSRSYVDLVLSIMRAYANGDYASVPTSSAEPSTFTRSYRSTVGAHRSRGERTHAKPGHGAGHGSPGGTSGRSSSGGSGSSTPSGPSAPGKGSTGGPTDGAGQPAGATQPVQDTAVGLAQATQICTDALKAKYGVAPAQAVSDCADQIKGLTKSEAESQLPGIVAGLADEVKNLVGSLLGN